MVDKFYFFVCFAFLCLTLLCIGWQMGVDDMKRKAAKRMKWKIFKSAKEYIIVRADSFDEALKKARRLDPKYCGGYIIGDE